MLVNQAIPSFVGGVSQQPATVRHPSQVDLMQNMVPSVASGARKRTGTAHGKKLTTTDWTNAFVHAIDRGTTGTTERYFVVIDQGAISVFDWNGDPHTVTYPDGNTYIASAPLGTLARDAFTATTVADYTFIVNKTIVPAMTAHTPVTVVQKVFVIVKVGVADTKYSVTLAGAKYEISIGTSGTDKQTAFIAAALKTAIDAAGLYTVTQLESMLMIQRTDNAAFTWAVNDTYGNQALFGFSDQVNRYESLPAVFVEGRTIEVTGDPNQTEDSFYVKWEKRDTNAGGVWVETRKNNIDYAFNATTMPHKLTRNSDNTFTFQKITWKDLLAGDNDSNPQPSFIGATINDVFFHRNRLGFLADENAIESQPADYFNFWNTSARAAVDSDPIDKSASSNEVAFLRHAIPFDKNMLILGDKRQFVLTSGDIHSPKTARLDPTTAFEVLASVKPRSLGSNVYFASPRGDFTALREYYFDGGAVNNDADDVTAHVPAYVPSGVFRLTACASEDMLFALTTNERNSVYVYNSKWNATKKVQSAWHKWTFGVSDVILSFDVFTSTAAMLTQRADGVYLDTMDLQEQPASPASYTLCLDRWVTLTNPTYNSVTDLTWWTIPYSLPSEESTVLVVPTKTGEIGQGLTPISTAGDSVALKGDYRGSTVIAGLKYTAQMILSRLFYRDEKTNAIIQCKTQIRDITVEFDRTGYFEVIVALTGRDEMRYIYSGHPLGLTSLIIGRQSVQSGKFKADVMGAAEDADITYFNISHLPCSFLSAEVQMNVAMQAARR
jgi:hypothetical protein